MSWLSSIFPNLSDTFSVKFLLSPVYLLATVILVWAVWMRGDRSKGFLSFMLPKALYRHPSTLMDIKLTIFNTFFIGSGAIAMLFVTPWVTSQILSGLVNITGYQSTQSGWINTVIAGVVLFLVQDFCRYWNHYLHHEYRYLWPFHAVHHSAEVMTPITFMRAHPLYSALQAIVISGLVGFAQAILLFAVVGQITDEILYGGTLAFNAYVFFGGHLRHSHVWLSYGRTWNTSSFHRPNTKCTILRTPSITTKTMVRFCDLGLDVWHALCPGREGRFDVWHRRSEGVGFRSAPNMRDALIGPFEEVWEEMTRHVFRTKGEKPKIPAE